MRHIRGKVFLSVTYHSPNNPLKPLINPSAIIILCSLVSYSIGPIESTFQEKVSLEGFL